jgi:hypothetical protein
VSESVIYFKELDYVFCMSLETASIVEIPNEPSTHPQQTSVVHQHGSECHSGNRMHGDCCRNRTNATIYDCGAHRSWPTGIHFTSIYNS